MSEHEFEAYLALLGRLLKLKPRQRAEIADELRDHLEERRQELLAEGLPSEQATVRAVEELGDAASLALEFTKFAHQRRRRWIMRIAAGSGIALAIGLFYALAYWPSSPTLNAPPQVVAQAPRVAENAALPGETKRGESPSVVEQKLEKQLTTVEFVDVPVVDALAFLAGQTGVDVLIDHRLKSRLEEEGLALDAPITIQLRHTELSARAVLQLILEQSDLDHIAGYTVRDGYVFITDKAETDQIKVYNVRDLVAGVSPAADPAAAMGGAMAGPAMMAGMPSGAAPSEGGGFGSLGGMGGGIGFATPQPGDTLLAQVIRATIRTDSWVDAGGEGSIAEYNGLLIVKHSPQVHREIEQLLQLMRTANGQEGAGRRE